MLGGGVAVNGVLVVSVDVFFFNDTATTEIYTLSLHDALPILPPARDGRGGGGRCAWLRGRRGPVAARARPSRRRTRRPAREEDRKSTRLNSSHANISYAVFCLKKKKTHRRRTFLSTPRTSD